MRSPKMEKKWVFSLIISCYICIFLVKISLNTTFYPLPFPKFAEMKIKHYPPNTHKIPRFAYLVSGSKGDLEKLWRTLLAIYHPRNQYVIHLDRESSIEERLKLGSRIEKDSIFSEVGNVFMVYKANMITYRGPTMIANTLHACAILLEKSKNWDWFINLSASDYPLVTQDDLVYTFSKLDRKLNFIEHTHKLGWKVNKRAKPLMIDHGLYMTRKENISWINQRRALPTSFKLFTGSAWMILSRSFVDYFVMGWDNLPRTLLMYYTNFVSSPEAYFHTLICNAPEFIETVINHDLHYIVWDNPPKQHPLTLSLNHTSKMIASNAAFARKFKPGSPVLDKIDKELLGRRNGRFTPGGWCSGDLNCSKLGDPDNIKPGPGARRLRTLIGKLVVFAKFGRSIPCTEM